MVLEEWRVCGITGVDVIWYYMIGGNVVLQEWKQCVITEVEVVR